jgi:hypothetical protein
LDLQWENYLSLQLPDDYKDEIRGIGDGGADAGTPGLDTLAQRGLTISNFPGM